MFAGATEALQGATRVLQDFGLKKARLRQGFGVQAGISQAFDGAGQPEGEGVVLFAFEFVHFTSELGTK